ncbi:hypothetical protein [Streptomyces sp. TRM70350]|uniref:hypothetical protein n=1 Tax=Streptomyces sp. TRM70350 TaxID=2856165 RepID=UPI001C45CA8C|nr:hypothetical protein [Streptomyces sp. TRM70350]MBV7699915.1 hypothetical protein [Streptomyces sp. TRM70350]
MNTATGASPANLGTLAALRTIGRRPAKSMNAMRHIANRQADLLGRLLPGTTHQVSAHVTSLIPTVVVESVARLPAPGITYWANRRWHIHVREGDSADERAFTVLHQLKQIIDHPIRRASAKFSDADWESLARHFACRVLAREAIAVSA